MTTAFETKSDYPTLLTKFVLSNVVANIFKRMFSKRSLGFKLTSIAAVHPVTSKSGLTLTEALCGVDAPCVGMAHDLSTGFFYSRNIYFGVIIVWKNIISVYRNISNAYSHTKNNVPNVQVIPHFSPSLK